MSFLHDSGTRATRRSPGTVSRGTTMRTSTPPSDEHHIRLTRKALPCDRHREGSRGSRRRKASRSEDAGTARCPLVRPKRASNRGTFVACGLHNGGFVISTPEPSLERVLLVAHEPRLRE